jgi:hypothetical protein
MNAGSLSARAFRWSTAATLALLGCGARSSLLVGTQYLGDGGSSTATSSSSGLMETCPAGCASPSSTFPPAVPLTPPDLPASCSGGFEINTPPTQAFTVPSVDPGGAPAGTLAIDIATYKAPDHLRITGADASGNVYTLLETCSLQTATYTDPTAASGSCTRPPDDSIRQYKATVQAGTTSLTFDYSGACTANYMRVLGLCDFVVEPFFPGCQFRAIP